MDTFLDERTLCCPYCGEEVSLEVEPFGAHSEEYVEDCPVCCRPWTVQVLREAPSTTSVALHRLDD